MTLLPYLSQVSPRPHRGHGWLASPQTLFQKGWASEWELESGRSVMRRKESNREKMGWFRGRIPNRLSCNRAPVTSNCSIIRMPRKMAIMMIITFRAKGRTKRQMTWCELWPSLSGLSLSISDQGFLGPLKRKNILSRAKWMVSPAPRGLVHVNSGG